MSLPSNSKDRWLTAAIVIVSVAGVLYFGLRAITDQARTDRENPYALDLSVFDRGDTMQPSYAQTQTIPVQHERPTGLALDGHGFLYVVGEERLSKHDSLGDSVDTIPLGQPAYCVAVDRLQRVYLGMRDHVQVLDPTGEVVGRWESLGPRAIVTSVAVLDSVVYVADAGQLLVWKFTTTGSLVDRFGRKDERRGVPGFVIPSPYFDVAFGPDGTVWVANTGRHSLENYSPSGSLNTSWGEYGTEIESFCGCCNPSHFAVGKDGSFVTSEKGIPRVKRYDAGGRLTAIVAEPEQFREGTEGLDLAVDTSGRIYVLDPVRKEVRVFTADNRTTEGTE